MSPCFILSAGNQASKTPESPTFGPCGERVHVEQEVAHAEEKGLGIVGTKILFLVILLVFAFTGIVPLLGFKVCKSERFLSLANVFSSVRQTPS